MGVPLSELAIEQKVLIWKELSARLGLPRHMIEHMELREVMDYVGDALIMQLRTFVLEDQLEPDVQRLHFVREVEVSDQLNLTLLAPRTLWDAVKAHCPRLRRALRLSMPRYRATAGARRVPRPRTAEVEINETVTIARSLMYPDPHIALDKRTWGQPIYVERFTHPTWRT